jgi:hypothetical protein
MVDCGGGGGDDDDDESHVDGAEVITPRRLQVAVLSDLLSESQEFIRKVEQDSSSTSLRDVQRCLNFLKWFRENLVNKGGPSTREDSPQAAPNPLD